MTLLIQCYNQAHAPNTSRDRASLQHSVLCFKMKVFILFAAAVALAAARHLPVEDEEENSAYNELRGGGVEGDMIFDDVRQSCYL